MPHYFLLQTDFEKDVDIACRSGKNIWILKLIIRDIKSFSWIFYFEENAVICVSHLCGE